MPLIQVPPVQDTCQNLKVDMEKLDCHMAFVKKQVAQLVGWMLWVVRMWVVHTATYAEEMVGVEGNYEVVAL